MSGKNKQINPVKRTTTIGVRELREITIWPLALGQELELGDIITEVVTEFVKGIKDKKGAKIDKTLASMENVEFVEFLINLFKTNIKKIVELTTDEKSDEFLNDVTNEQFLDYATIVYEMNYGGDVRKKLMTLIGSAMMLEKKVKKQKKKVAKKQEK